MSVRCVDAETLADLSLFVDRAERLGAATIRLSVLGSALVSTAPVLVPKGIVDSTPLIIAIRISEIEQSDSAFDEVVSIRAMKERLVRFPAGENGPLEFPPVTLNEAWAGISPPRTGWEAIADVDLDVLRLSAERTLGTLADITTTQPEQLLSRALSAHDEQLDAPAGLAAAAQSLGFLGGSEPARLARAGRWSRLSTRAGHVLSRV